MNRNLKEKFPNSKFFTHGELIKSDIAIRNNLDNNPPEHVWKNLENLVVHILNPLREKFGPIRVLSGYRSKELCSLPALGSNPKSNHTTGNAADIEPVNDKFSLIDLCEFITTLNYHRIILEFPPNGWVHVEYKQTKPSKSILLKDNKHFYTETTIENLKKLF